MPSQAGWALTGTCIVHSQLAGFPGQSRRAGGFQGVAGVALLLGHVPPPRLQKLSCCPGPSLSPGWFWVRWEEARDGAKDLSVCTIWAHSHWRVYTPCVLVGVQGLRQGVAGSGVTPGPSCSQSALVWGQLVCPRTGGASCGRGGDTCLLARLHRR